MDRKIWAEPNWVMGYRSILTHKKGALKFIWLENSNNGRRGFNPALGKEKGGGASLYGSIKDVPGNNAGSFLCKMRAEENSMENIIKHLAIGTDA